MASNTSLSLSLSPSLPPSPPLSLCVYVQTKTQQHTCSNAGAGGTVLRNASVSGRTSAPSDKSRDALLCRRRSSFVAFSNALRHCSQPTTVVLPLRSYSGCSMSTLGVPSAVRKICSRSRGQPRQRQEKAEHVEPGTCSAAAVKAALAYRQSSPHSHERTNLNAPEQASLTMNPPTQSAREIGGKNQAHADITERNHEQRGRERERERSRERERGREREREEAHTHARTTNRQWCLR